MTSFPRRRESSQSHPPDSNSSPRGEGRGGDLASWITRTARRLARAKLFFGHGALNARDEAAWITAHACRIPPPKFALHLAKHLRRPMSAAEQLRGDAIAAERIASRKPLAYLLGEAWLAGLRFKIDERVIVPRSFIAELLPGSLHEDALAPWIDPSRVSRVLDLCTGSGCLAILAARAFPQARVDAIDISPDALAVARENIRLHGMTHRVRAIESDLFSAVEPPQLKQPRRYDLILCNPPYVDAPSMRALPAEYHREPRLALAGGRDGLDLVRKILRAAREHLTPGGLLVMEIGHNRRVLERAYPRTPFMWLETSAGDDMVFLLAEDGL